jgi:hypothetical protein
MNIGGRLADQRAALERHQRSFLPHQQPIQRPGHVDASASESRTMRSVRSTQCKGKVDEYTRRNRLPLDDCWLEPPRTEGLYSRAVEPE